jgi:hypothetical protein
MMCTICDDEKLRDGHHKEHFDKSAHEKNLLSTNRYCNMTCVLRKTDCPVSNGVPMTAVDDVNSTRLISYTLNSYSKKCKICKVCGARVDDALYAAVVARKEQTENGGVKRARVDESTSKVDDAVLILNNIHFF